MATRIDYGITPNDINALAAVIATELGLTGKGIGDKPIDVGGEQNYYSQLEADAILDALVNRQMISQADVPSPAVGSKLNNTLANVAMKPYQFSGLNKFSRNLYGNPELTEDEYLAAIRAGLGSDISDELFNRAIKDVNNYFKRRIAAGGNAIGPFKDDPVTHFINARIGNMAKTQDAWTDKHLRLITPGEGNYGEYTLPEGFVTPAGEEVGGKLWYPSHNFLYNTRYNPREDTLNPYTGKPYENLNTGLLLGEKEGRFIASPYNYSLTGVPGISTKTNIPVSNFDNFQNIIRPMQGPYEAENFNTSLPPSLFSPLDSSTDTPPTISPSMSTVNTVPVVAPLSIVGDPPRDIRTPGQDYGGANQRMVNEILENFNLNKRPIFKSDGTPSVGNYGSEWSSTHNDMLLKSIEGLRNRFPEATNEELINSLQNSNVVKDINAQVNYMAMNPGSQLGTPPPIGGDSVPRLNTNTMREPSVSLPSLGDPTNTDTVPAMLTPGEAVIPAEAAQLKRNRAEIQRMVDEGRDIQNKKEELDISPLDQSENENIANNKKINKDTGFKKRMKEFFYPFGPGGAAGSPEQTIEPEVTPGFQNIISPMQGPSVPPMQGPDRPTLATPQQYINDGSDYTPEQKEKQNKIVNELPEDPRLNTLDNNTTIERAKQAIKNNRPFAEKMAEGMGEVTNWVEKNLGFNKQDLYRSILYYVGGRLSGGSHGGSLRWAARQVIKESGDRATLQAQSAASNTLSKSQQLNYYKDLAKTFLKSPGLTLGAKRKLEKALAAGDIQSMANVINNTGGKFRTEIGIKADTTKPIEVFLKDGYENNTFVVYPSIDGSGLNYYINPENGELTGINPNKIRKFTASIEDNIPNIVARHYDGGDKIKLKTIFNLQSGGAFATKLRNYAEEKNMNTDELTNVMISLLGGMAIPEGYDPEKPNSFKPEKGYRSLEAALDMVVLSGGKQADLSKLENVNQANVNKMVEDFGGASEATKVLQAVDATLNAEPISPEKVEAGIKNLTDKEKAIVAKQPNDYFKLLYMAYFSSKVKE